MKFFEIIKLFRQGRSSARSHIKNLVEMALVDGNFDLIEYNLLQRIARRNNISESSLRAIKEDPSSVDFEIPENQKERFQQFYDLVHMMTIDSTVHPDEMNLCNLFAMKFGYPREKRDEIISIIQSDIVTSRNVDETYQRVSRLLSL